MFNLFFHFGKSKTSLNWKNFLNWTCLNQKTTVIQYSKIYLYLTVFVGFLMMSQMMHGRKIPGIIKKINKALFGKVIYSKYYKLSNKSSRFFEQSGHQGSIEIFFNFTKNTLLLNSFKSYFQVQFMVFNKKLTKMKLRYLLFQH